MIKRSTFISAGLTTLGIAAAVAASNGCSSSSGSTGPSGPSGNYTPIVPPARGATAGTGSTKWFAVKQLLLGLSVKGSNGTKLSADAWKDYGFDLDGRDTSADDSKNNTNTCKRVSGAATGILVDGNGGIDNNFGAHVMQTIKSLKSDAEDAVNQSITKGDFTLLLKIDNFTTTDNNHAPGAIYIANNFNGGASSPTFTPADVWKITDASLVPPGTDITQPKLTFPQAYISNGYWVSGNFGSGTINLQITLSGASIELPIESGIVTVKVADGTDGTIAGAMDTGQLKSALTPVAEKFGICPGNATFDQVVTTLTQSADLVTGAPQLQDTSVTCNAISVAIGFAMAETGTPTQIAPSPTSTGSGDCTGAEGDAGGD